MIPGEHMLPTALDAPTALDDIRVEHKVYITKSKPNIIVLQSDSITRLKEALKAVNWAIYGFRLSNEPPTTKFLVKAPVNAAEDALIKFEARPRFTDLVREPLDNRTALDRQLDRLAADMAASAKTLMAVNNNLKLRVNFGELRIRAKQKSVKDQIEFDSFVRQMLLYSPRGGASLETR